MKLSSQIVCVIMLSAIHAAASIDHQVIYGEDSRREVYEERDPIKLELAKSVASVINRSALIREKDGSYRIDAKTYKAEYGLCDGERFGDQLSAGECTASLVAPNMILTAGHCIQSKKDCQDYRFVFDFAVLNQGESSTRIQSRNIFKCKRVIKSVSEEMGKDFAVILLDRPVRDRMPLMVRTSGTPAVGTWLFVIGSPSGIPLKIADGASIRAIMPEYLVANLDVYAGNSGSPIFNEATNEIEGILVRGENDFEYSSEKHCMASKVCADDECRGEEIMPIAPILRYISPK